MELADAFWHAFGLCYTIYMAILGLLTVRLSSRDEKLRVLGLGLLGIGLGDGSHVVGHILADLYGGLPAKPTWADAFEAIATAVSVSLATIFFLTLQLYASRARGSRGLTGLDKALAAVALIAVAASFTNWVYLQALRGLYLSLLKAEGRLGQHPEALVSMVVAVLCMVVAGYVGGLSLLRLAREGKAVSGPAAPERNKLVYRGMIIMLLAVTFVLVHPFLTGMPLLLRAITALKVLCLLAAATLTYAGLVGPEWLVERLS